MARTIGASIRQPAIDDGRSLEDNPLFGIPRDRRVPVHGRRRGRVLGHRPARVENGATVGTDPAPLAEVPNRSGADPHGRPRKDPNAQIQKVEFMLNGDVIDVCGVGPVLRGRLHRAVTRRC